MVTFAEKRVMDCRPGPGRGLVHETTYLIRFSKAFKMVILYPTSQVNPVKR